MSKVTPARRRQMERNLRRASALARDVIAHPEQYPDRFVAIPLEPDPVASLLSRERLRLLRELRDEGPYDSVGALAKALGREATRVSRDVAVLSAVGLVLVERRGKAKRVRAVNRPIILA